MSDIALGEKAVSDIAASDIVETVPSALIILDRNLNITSANRAFYQTFRTSRGETEGCHIYDLGNRQWDIPALRTLLESVIPHRASVEGFEVEHDFPTIGRRTMLVNARKIFVPATMMASFCWPSRTSVKNVRPKREQALLATYPKYRRHDPRSPGRARKRHDDRDCEQGFFDDIRDYRGGDAGTARFRTRPAPMGRAGASPFDGEGASGKQADRKL